MSIDLLTDESVSALTEPPKAWRNWFQVGPRMFPAFCNVCNTYLLFQPGEVFASHCRVHPSKDLAETHAARVMHAWEVPASYLGAFPEGERP